MYSISFAATPSLEEDQVTNSKAYLTMRVEEDFKRALAQAADAEHRTLSNFSRLLLEYAFAHYREAGSIHKLLLPHKRAVARSA